MDRQEAIKKLIEAGKDDEVDRMIEKRLGDASAAYAQIRADSTRTEDYKLAELAQHYEAHNEGMTADLVALARRTVSSDQKDVRGALGVDGLPGDPASLAISRRDAGDRVAAIESTVELRRLLERATRQGDEVLARAIADRALEHRDGETLQMFIDERPALADQVQRIWDAQSRQESTTQGSFMAVVKISGLKPSELGGMTTWQISEIANQPA